MTANYSEKFPLFKVRTFRAVDEPDLAAQYHKGATAFFNSVGLGDITSASDDWLQNPHAYVMAVYSKGRVVAGARLHVFHAEFPYPLTYAIDGRFDINKFIKKDGSDLHGEACGLWIHTQNKGLGLMQYLSAGIPALGRSLGLDKVYLICPRHTMDSLRRIGYICLSEEGEVLRFMYPTDTMTSYFLVCDVKNLEFCARKERRTIERQRKAEKKTMLIKGRLGESIIRSETGLPSELPSNLPIEEAKERETKERASSAPMFFRSEEFLRFLNAEKVKSKKGRQEKSSPDKNKKSEKGLIHDPETS